MEQSRLKSPIVWLSIIAQVVLMVGLANQEIADIVKIVGTAVVEILTLIGILNNPTSKDSF